MVDGSDSPDSNAAIKPHLREFISDITGDAAPPFALAVTHWGRYRLPMFPLGGDDGKIPLVKWGRFQKGQSDKTRAKFARQHPSANVALVLGPASGVTVLDIDDADQTAILIEKFGDSPLKVATPSGGLHLYYRNNNERSRNLRSEGLAAEIKAIGNYVAIPPSRNPHTGKAYKFIDGDYSLLAAGPLPTMRAYVSAFGAGAVNLTRKPIEGERNDTLFRHLLREARACDDLAALIDVALTLNGDFDVPLPEAEAMKCACSAWKKEVNGSNFSGAGQQLTISAVLFGRIRHNKNAAPLYLHLRQYHNPGDEFAIVCGSMSAEGSIGMNTKTIRAARNVLLEAGALTLIYKGGRGLHDPSIYRLNPV